MTASLSPQSSDHMIQICGERSSRGVATRADWERLREINPERAKQELRTFLLLDHREHATNPFEKSSRPRRGLVIGFVAGVVFMVCEWLLGSYLHANVVSSGLQWNLVTLSQYVAASMIPLFAWIGYRIDTRNHQADEAASPRESLRDASWEELLDKFDATRKAGGTRMY